MKFKKVKILFLLLLIVPVFAIAGNGHINKFDSTQCNGYQFFVSKGITFDSTSNLKLYNELYSWRGVPYRYGGKSKRGTDCSGFATMIYKNVYSISLVGGSAGSIYNKVKHIEKSELKEGALIFFSFNHRYIAHVGIYLSNNKFIHETSWGRGVMISDLNEPYYKKFYFSSGRFEQTIACDSLVKSN